MDVVSFSRNVRGVDELQARRIFIDHDERLAAVEATGGAQEASEVKIINLGTDWSDGDRRSVYNADKPAPQKAEIKLGTKASPDTDYGPAMMISRTLNVLESDFAGAGEAGLAALTVTTLAVEGSEGQAIGGSFGAVTESSHEGAHSLADGIALSAVGVSRKGTRTGMGLFAMGRRETAEGRTTGMEVVSDNETETPETYAGTLPGTKGIHLHPVGTANSAAGLVIGHPSTAAWDVGIGAIAGSVVTSTYRDDSSSLRSILVKGSHEKAAVAVAAGAGHVVIGTETPKLATPLLEVYSETTLDPIISFGSDKGVSVRAQLIRNSVGTVETFAAAATNAFHSGTVSGDSGLDFTAGNTFHIAAIGKPSIFRISELGVAVNGNTPIAKATAIASPAAELAPLKAAVDFLREAVKNFGITA